MPTSLPHSTFSNNHLEKVRKIPFLRDSTIEAHFQHQRKLADSQNPEVTAAWFKAMKVVFQEIDGVFKLLPGDSTFQFRFLDVGCCPGGFSSYILSSCPGAVGEGISLNVELGGHKFELEDKYRSRFTLNWADATYYQLGPEWIFDPRLIPIPYPPQSLGFSLVLLDGHALRTSSNDATVYFKGDRLLISQLILGLWTVVHEGTIVIKLSSPSSIIVIQILYMLDILCGSLQTWKPVYIHATRPTFYAIARYMGCGRKASRYNKILLSLKKLWVELTFGGTGSNGRQLNDHDLNFVGLEGTENGIQKFIPRWNELCGHVITVQEQSLQGWHKAKASGF